jgi:acyl dehydratase
VPAVLPTFGAAIAERGWLPPDIGAADRTKGLLYAQALTVHGEIPLEGRAVVTTRVAAMHDHGWGAVVDYESMVVEARSGRLLGVSQKSSFLPDVGGFGTAARPVLANGNAGRTPDLDVVISTRQEQALLYRLCGDRNPLHSDPVVAVRAGFMRPILHGLCTFGIIGRVLLQAACDGDLTRFHGMAVHFRRRVYPGESLRLMAWRDADHWSFRVADATGAVAIEHGSVTTAVPVAAG